VARKRLAKGAHAKPHNRATGEGGIAGLEKGMTPLSEKRVQEKAADASMEEWLKVSRKDS